MSDESSDQKNLKVVLGMAKTSAHALAAIVFMAARYISEPEGPRNMHERAKLAVEEANALFCELDLLPDHLAAAANKPDQRTPAEQ